VDLNFRVTLPEQASAKFFNLCTFFSGHLDVWISGGKQNKDSELLIQCLLQEHEEPLTLKVSVFCKTKFFKAY